MSNKNLRNIANSLQPFPKFGKDGKEVTRPYSMKGSFCIEKFGKGAINKDGEPFDPERWYFATEPVYVDHFTELKKVWTRWGADGVKKYIDIVTGYNPATGEIALPKEEYEEVLGKIDLEKKPRGLKDTIAQDAVTAEMKIVPHETELENGQSDSKEGVQPLQDREDRGSDAAE